jgi:cell division protein FtsI (penicillin-binding protein 3)
VQQVFEKSSNIGVAKLTNQYFNGNPMEYANLIKKFGLPKPLGFQMAGEALPYIKDPKDRTWSRTSLTTMSIGYELKLAPLQTLAFYNAVANGGVKVQPIIVKEIKQADKVLEQFEAPVLNAKICSDETLRKLRAMMEGVVVAGTARAIRPKDYSIAGKTGTAWKFKNGQYTRTYSTSFCGYFPAEQPKYSCIVVIDSPSKGRIYGGDVAAPVFREIADKCMARDQASQRPMLARVPARRTPVPLVRAGVQDEIALVCQRIGLPAQTQATGGEEWVRATHAMDTAVVTRAVEVTPNKTVARAGRMPDARGLTLRDALFLLENRGLKVRTSGTGRVREQSIATGELVKRGAVVSLALAPTAALAAAPMALPEPTHTEIVENTLLVPAEHESRPVRSTKLTAAKPAKLAEKPTKAKSSAKSESTSTKDNATKTKPTKSTAPRSEKKSTSPKRTTPADIRTTQRPAAKPAVANAGRAPKSA